MSAALDLIQRAQDDAEAIAVHLLGEPNKRLCTSRELRWGEHGKISMALTGPYRGKWRDWSDMERYGDALDLIGLELRLDRPAALEWLRVQWFCGAVEPIDHAQRAMDRAAAAEAERLERLKLVKAASGIWQSCQPFAGSLAETYLRGRLCGLDVPSEVVEGGALRFHPVPYRDLSGSVGAMVALMTDPLSNKPTGIHRTFLDASGNKLGRKMLGIKGVVRLWPDDAVTLGLSIGEGIETTLAGQLLFGSAPAWAALDAGNLAVFPVLSGVEALELFLDNDPPDKNGRQAGQEAGEACGQRWVEAGREVTLRTPKQAERDFVNTLETLTGKGAAA